MHLQLHCNYARILDYSCTSLRYTTLHHTTLHYTRLNYTTITTESATTTTITTTLHYTTLQIDRQRGRLKHTQRWWQRELERVRERERERESFGVGVGVGVRVRVRDRERERETHSEPPPPFDPSVGSLCHPFITTTPLSYSSLSLKFPPPPCTTGIQCQWSHQFNESIPSDTCWSVTLSW